MILKQRLFTNMFLRNMLADFGNRSAYSRLPGSFIPYFQYKVYDIITYLEFHYSAYGEKHDFLRFLQYEIADRLKQQPKESRRQKLQSAREWVTEQQQELQRSQQATLKQEIEQEVKEIFSKNP